MGDVITFKSKSDLAQERIQQAVNRTNETFGDIKQEGLYNPWQQARNRAVVDKIIKDNNDRVKAELNLKKDTQNGAS